MKKYFYTPVLVLLLSSLMTLRAQNSQEYLGLPGDNLNLFAVMKLFQESETLEGFERDLNAENSRVNNLDLNGDNYVDYIRVIDNVDRNVHFIVLQVAINPRENQDVAVFTVVQENNGNVTIQLVGDEELYGQNYIVEPIMDETPNPGYMGKKVNGQRVTVVRTNTYEIATWPLVHFIFAPSYIVWRSPWNWNYYPSYWHPWNAHYWHYYYGYHYNYYGYYYGHFRHWNNHRYDYYRNGYHSHHYTHSAYVRNRIHEGQYKTTYSKPEQRRAGTELYHATRRTSNPGTNATSAGGRRTSSGSATPTTSRSSTRPSSEQNVRSSSGTSRTSSDQSVRTNSNTNTRSTSGQSVKTNTNTRSTSGQSVRTNSGSSSSKPTTTVRSSGQRSGSSGVSSSGRRSGNTESSGSSGTRKSTRESSSSGSSSREGGRR